MDIGKRIRDLREERGLTQREVARRAGLTPSGVGFIEHGQTRNPSAETVLAVARALGVPVEELLREPVPLDETLAPPGPSERAALTDEGSLRLLAPIAPTAIALNAQFAPDVDANDFTIEEYEQVGEAFTRHDRQMADAMSKYSHSGVGASGAPEAVREAFNRAWVSMQELQYTLQRAYEKLVRREEAGVTKLEEFRQRAG